jgi:hypothetical protein
MVIIIRQYNVTFRKVSTHIIVMCHTNLKVKCSYIFFFTLPKKIHNKRKIPFTTA